MRGARAKAVVARKTARRVPRRAEQRRTARPRAAKSGARAPRPLLTRAELRRAVVELANTLAPADVADLLAEESTVRDHAARLDGTPGTILRAQLDLAIACLRDHIAGECPQIPFYTISLLAAGIAYLVEDLDVVPDFLPRIGTLDDALVMALACQLASDGLRRYCTWKDITLDPALALDGRPRKPGRSA